MLPRNAGSRGASSAGRGSNAPADDADDGGGADAHPSKKSKKANPKRKRE